MNYHPVTLEYGISSTQQLDNIFQALGTFEVQIVITGSNAETGRNEIPQF